MKHNIDGTVWLAIHTSREQRAAGRKVRPLIWCPCWDEATGWPPTRRGNVSDSYFACFFCFFFLKKGLNCKLVIQCSWKHSFGRYLNSPTGVKMQAVLRAWKPMWCNRFSPLNNTECSGASTETLVHAGERNKKLGYMWVVIFSTVAIFPWQWSQIQLTLISVFSRTRCVWEKASLCPPSIKGLISASVEYVNPFRGPLALSPCPRDPYCPALPPQVGGRGGSGITSAKAWRPGASSPAWLFVASRRGRRRGVPHNPIDQPHPHMANALASPVVQSVEWRGPAFLSESGQARLVTLSFGFTGAENTPGSFAGLTQSSPDYNLIHS